MEKVVIIGTGCAGLTAALYTARANLSPLVLTGTMPGGLLTTTSIVENYPGFPEGIDGYELMVRMQKQAERFGARVQFGTVEAVDLKSRPFVLTVDGEPIKAETIIIASGASHRHLGLESEEKLEKKGVTYCATCDGALPMFRKQPLVVVGGGDSACEEATYLTRFASVVYLVHRRDTLRASKIMVQRTLAHSTIKPVWNSIVTEVLGLKEDKVVGVRVKNVVTGAESVLHRDWSHSQHANLQGHDRHGRERIHHPEKRHCHQHFGSVCCRRLFRPRLPPGRHCGGPGLRSRD